MRRFLIALLTFVVMNIFASKHDISTAKLISSGLDLDYFLKNMELEMKDYRSVHPNKRSGSSFSDDDREFLKAAWKEYRVTTLTCLRFFSQN